MVVKIIGDDFSKKVPQKDYGPSLRRVVRDRIRRGATHTEIALDLIKHGSNLRVNPRFYTVDAVLARFVEKNPSLARKHADALVEASHLERGFEKANNSLSLPVWALVSAHLFYPEFVGKHVHGHSSKEDAEKHLDAVLSDVKNLLSENKGKHENIIASFLDYLSLHTAMIRELIDEEDKRVMELSEDPDKTLSLLRSKGIRTIVLHEDEDVDPNAFPMAMSDGENLFIVTKKEDSILRVALHSPKGCLSSNLYRALNEEERKRRGVSNLKHGWMGWKRAGGSPLDGTHIPFDRIALILSLHV
ncbi:MAG: hypothetical protein ACTSVF_05190 [Candidatus Asgardarchaeia archaeon]